MTNGDSTRWRRKDAWLGLLFTTFGALVLAYALLAIRNGMPIVLWGTALLFGPLLLLLGLHSLVRSLRARD